MIIAVPIIVNTIGISAKGTGIAPANAAQSDIDNNKAIVFLFPYFIISSFDSNSSNKFVFSLRNLSFSSKVSFLFISSFNDSTYNFPVCFKSLSSIKFVYL